MKSVQHSAWRRVKAESVGAKMRMTTTTTMKEKNTGNIVLAKGDAKTAQALEREDPCPSSPFAISHHCVLGHVT